MSVRGREMMLDVFRILKVELGPFCHAMAVQLKSHSVEISVEQLMAYP